MSGKGGNGDQEVTQRVEIPEFLRQPLQQTARQFTAESLRQPQFFPGQTVVPFAPETALALQLQRASALQGSPLVPAATQQVLGQLQGATPGVSQLAQTAGGAFLPGGAGEAGFQRAFGAAARQVLPQVRSTFTAAGRTGSGLARQAETQALADAFAGLFGQERQRQLAAAQALPQLQQAAAARAPALAQARFGDIGQLAQVGAAREALAQRQVQDQLQRFQFLEDARRQRLLQALGALQGFPVGQTQVTQGGGTSPLAGALGGGLTGLGVLQSLGLGGAEATGLAALGGPQVAIPVLAGSALLGGLLS